jgi:RNA-binding protein
MPSTPQEKKRYRSIGHKLRPVVTVAEKGLTDNVKRELNRALEDHELIKVKIAVGDRQARNAIRDELIELLGAEAIQQIGHVVLLYRAAKKPDPRLSNLLRELT